MSVPDPFNRFHELNHNSAIAYEIQLEFSDQRVKAEFSSRLKILVIRLIFLASGL